MSGHLKSFSGNTSSSSGPVGRAERIIYKIGFTLLIAEIIFQPGAIVAADTINLLHSGNTNGGPGKGRFLVDHRFPVEDSIYFSSLLVLPLGSPERHNSDQSGTVRGRYCGQHYDPTEHKAQSGFDMGRT